MERLGLMCPSVVKISFYRVIYHILSASEAKAEKIGSLDPATYDPFIPRVIEFERDPVNYGGTLSFSSCIARRNKLLLPLASIFLWRPSPLSLSLLSCENLATVTANNDVPVTRFSPALLNVFTSN